MPGSIETRSAASGWNDGLSVKTKRAMPRFVVSPRLPVPPAPMLPPLITVTPGCSVSAAVCVWPTRNTSGRDGGLSLSTSSAGAISAGSWTITMSTLPISGCSQPLNLSCSARLGVSS